MPDVERITRRTTFEALRASAARAGHGAVRVAYVPLDQGDEDGLPRVAYAVGRRCGNAVTRNRLRRRLRAAVRRREAPLVPGAYLIATAPSALELTFPQLAAIVRAAMDQAAARGVEVAGAGRE